MTPETLLAAVGADHVVVLKIDIEGLELELLPSLCRSVLDRIDQLTVEFHDSIGIGSIKQVRHTIAYIASFGFVVMRGSFFDYSDVLFLHRLRLNMPWNWRWLATAEGIRNGISRRLARALPNKVAGAAR